MPTVPSVQHRTAAMHNAINASLIDPFPLAQGTVDSRKAAAAWMEQCFGVGGINPNNEILFSISSKEAIHNTFIAFVSPGDYTLIPEPCYPVYRSSTLFAGGQPYTMPLLLVNGFLPNLDRIPEDVARRTKLFWINYPNNPTSALATPEDFARMVEFCQKYDILLCHDHTDSEIAYDGYQPPSILQVPGAKEIALEFHSLSGMYPFKGWRAGFVVGSAKAIKAVTKVKTYSDAGMSEAIQRTAIAAFETSAEERQQVMSVYQDRRDKLIAGLQSLGWPIEPPKATLYVWVPVPKGYTSTEFVTLLLEKCGIIFPPGNGYGAAGEGFFRIALTAPEEQLDLMLERMKEAGIRYQ